MFKISTLLTLLFICSLAISAQDSTYYALYNSKGKQVGIATMIEELAEQDIVLFGELHNDQTLHELQLTVAQRLNDKKRLMFGAEMLERHNQSLIDEYLQDIIDTSHLFEEADLWPNFKSDYLPLLDFAKEKKAPFIATNIPRTLAKIAAFKNIKYLDSIRTDTLNSLMCPFPFSLPEKAKPYKELIKSDFGASHGMDTRKIVAAQALKDATMASSILELYNSERIFLHFNGDFHSKDHGGIAYWLNFYSDKKLDISVISSVESNSLDFKKEWKKQGDFIIVVLENGPKSY
jgi:uncharacterized iron-regulated protein